MLRVVVLLLHKRRLYDGPANTISRQRFFSFCNLIIERANLTRIVNVYDSCVHIISSDFCAIIIDQLSFNCRS